MKYLLLSLLLLPSIGAQAATLYAPDGTPLMRQTQQGNRLVERQMDGTPMGYWQKEGNAMVYRKMDGTLVVKQR